MAAIQPYLTFNDQCEAAFNFYKSVLGGEFANFTRFKEMPSEQSDPKEADKVMHVALPYGNGSMLMGSDTPAHFGTVTNGTNFSLALNPDSREDATRLFNGLSAGGTVTMPMGDAPWGAFFGMFTDKFGIQWMVNYQLEEKK